MDKIGYILLGWLLGLLGSHTLRWSDRNQKINDFINGLYAQMLEIHPGLVMTYCSINGILGPLSKETIEWTISMLPTDHNFVINENLKKLIEVLLKCRKEDFEIASKEYFKLVKSIPSGKELKKFDLSFLENNLSTISLLDNDLQQTIWKIIHRINLINQNTDSYIFYFRKTFEPEVMKVNEANLKINIENCLKMISKDVMNTADVALELLKDLKTFKKRWTYKIIC